MALSAGTRLGPYVILAPLGAGGMGEVYKARDTRLDRTVAIKVLPAALASDPQFRERFDREAKAISQLNHPHICTLHDIGSQDGVDFLVMEYLEGETLARRLEKGPLPLDQVLTLAIQIADALATAHRTGITHRDLKPANLMLTKAGAKVLDFGLAKVSAPVDADGPTKLLPGPDLTTPGMILGTVQYMAPEQIEGKHADARTDIFAFGVVLFEMLSGKKAFTGANHASLMAAILEREPPSLSSLQPLTPRVLDRLVSTCLAKDPDDRWQTARDLVRELQWTSDAGGAVPRPRRNVKSVDSLAVLPLVNASGDPETEYLSDGITESLINSLSQLPNLRVIPRTSAFRYKDRQADPLCAGRDLNVRAVLTGKVLQRGDSLIVQAELVDVGNESQIWGGQYNRKLVDIFALQEDIAQEILERLRVRLTGEEKRRLVKRPSKSAEAYQLYLKGRYYWSKRTAEGLQRGIEYFQQTIKADKNYALAYTGLADSYMVLNYYGLPSREAGPRAKAAAERAVEIDDRLAEAHTSLAFATLLYDWDWLRAERGFKRAIDLNPGYWEAHDWYALSFAAVGRFEEAIGEMKRAQELDPLSLVLHHHAAWVFILAREYGRAIEQSRTALEMEPNFGLAHVWLGKALEQEHMYEEAIAALHEALRLLSEQAFVLGTLGHIYATCGHRGEAEQVLQHLKELSSQRYIEPYYMAAIFAALEETDQAFEWLQKAYDDRSCFFTSFLKGDPWLDSLRPDPRFEDLLRRFGPSG